MLKKNMSSDARFSVSNRLGQSAYNGLIGKKPVSWSWLSYQRFYRDYCEESFQFVCHKSEYHSSTLVGNITHDWHPLGFARYSPSELDPCASDDLKKLYCKIDSWPDVDSQVVKNIGSRVFMTENSKIDTIEGRIMIDFNEPNKQIIPMIYASDSNYAME